MSPAEDCGHIGSGIPAMLLAHVLRCQYSGCVHFPQFFKNDVDGCKLRADKGNSFRVMDPGKCFAV